MKYLKKYSKDLISSLKKIEIKKIDKIETIIVNKIKEKKKYIYMWKWRICINSKSFFM